MPHPENHGIMCGNRDCSGRDGHSCHTGVHRGRAVPEVSMLLMSSRKPSSATCASVNRKIIILFSSPSFMYRFFRSSRKLFSE